MLESHFNKTASHQDCSFIKETATQTPSHETRKNSKNTPLYRTPLMMAPGERQNMPFVQNSKGNQGSTITIKLLCKIMLVCQNLMYMMYVDKRQKAYIRCHIF